MRSANQIVESICKFLSSEEQLFSPEIKSLAEEYAAACRDFNRRLEQIDSLLDQGKNGEAVEAAIATPPVAKLLEALDFKHRADWEEICDLYGMAMPPAVETSVVERLGAAYGAEQAKAPLLDRYRKAVQKGTVAERLTAVRDLALADPANEAWEKDIRRWEEMRLPELMAEARQAIESRDENVLLNVHDQLCKARWIVKPDKNVIGKVERELADFRKKRLRRRANRVLETLGEAYGALSLTEVLAALEQWDALAKDKEFSPQEADLLQVDDARSWAKAETRAAAEEKKIKELQTEFTAALEARDFPKAEKTFFKLQRRDCEVDSILLQRLHILEGEHQLAQQRRQRQRIIVISMVFALVLIAGFAGVHFYMQQKEYNGYLAELQAALGKGDVETASGIVQRISSNRGKFLGRAEMVTALSELEKQKTAEVSRLARFNDAMHELDKASKSGFPEVEKAEGLLTEVKNMIRNSSEDRRVRDMTLLVAEAQAIAQKKRDADFMTHASELDKHLRMVEKLDMDTETTRIGTELGAILAMLAELDAVEGITESLRKSQGEMLRMRYDSLVRRHGQAAEKNEKLAAGMARLWRSARSIGSYLEALQDLVDAAPTDPQVQKLVSLLRDAPLYREAEALAEWTPHESKLTEFRQLREKWPTGIEPQVFGGELLTFLDWRIKELGNISTVRTGLEDLAKSPLLTRDAWYYEFKLREGGVERLVMLDKKPLSTSGNRITLYAYDRLRDGTPQYRTLISDADGWSLENENKQAIRKGMRMVAGAEHVAASYGHVTFSARMIDDVKRCSDDELLTLIGLKIEEVKNEKAFSALMRMLVLMELHRLGSLLLDGGAFEKCQAQFEAINLAVRSAAETDWIKVELSEKKRLSLVESTGKLPKFQDLCKAELFRRHTYAMAFGRKLSYAGILRETEGVVGADLIGTREGDELWILTPAEMRGNGSFMFVGKVVAGAPAFSPDCLALLSQGSILFAPKDRRETIALAEDVKKTAKKYGFDVEWPVAWPINAR